MESLIETCSTKESKFEVAIVAIFGGSHSRRIQWNIQRKCEFALI